MEVGVIWVWLKICVIVPPMLYTIAMCRQICGPRSMPHVIQCLSQAYLLQTGNAQRGCCCDQGHVGGSAIHFGSGSVKKGELTHVRWNHDEPCAPAPICPAYNTLWRDQFCSCARTAHIGREAEHGQPTFWETQILSTWWGHAWVLKCTWAPYQHKFKVFLEMWDCSNITTTCVMTYADVQFLPPVFLPRFSTHWLGPRCFPMARSTCFPILPGPWTNGGGYVRWRLQFFTGAIRLGYERSSVGQSGPWKWNVKHR